MYFAYNENGDFIGFFSEIIHDNIPNQNLRISEQLWNELLQGYYKVKLSQVNNYDNELLDLMDKDKYFIKVEPEVIEIEDEIDGIKVLAKQVGLLTLENKKKDVQIESLMKAVKALTNK